MPLLVHVDSGHHARGLAVWRIVVWLILLFAAFGCLQYVRHAGAVWTQLQLLPVANREAVTALRTMLAWDAAYLLAAFAVIVVCAGGILRQAWARPSLRWVSLLLAVWVAISGGLLLAAMPADAAPATMLAQLPHSYLLALAMKVVAIPLLLWLAWRLGHPAVRAQFRSRRR